jgi:hypothetical protein
MYIQTLKFYLKMYHQYKLMPLIYQSCFAKSTNKLLCVFTLLSFYILCTRFSNGEIFLQVNLTTRVKQAF